MAITMKIRGAVICGLAIMLLCLAACGFDADTPTPSPTPTPEPRMSAANPAVVCTDDLDTAPSHRQINEASDQIMYSLPKDLWGEARDRKFMDYYQSLVGRQVCGWRGWYSGQA